MSIPFEEYAIYHGKIPTYYVAVMDIIKVTIIER